MNNPDTEKTLEQKRVEFAGIPKRYIGKTFDAYKVSAPTQKHALDVCRDYAARFSEHYEAGRCVFLSGSVGAGKTHLACAIAQELCKAEKGKTFYAPRYTTASGIIREIRATWGKGAAGSEKDAIDKFTRPDLLIIDEIGVQFGSDAERTQLTELIDIRYRKMLPTLVITNLDQQGAAQILGDRAIDRLRENGGIALAFNWASYRAAA